MNYSFNIVFGVYKKQMNNKKEVKTGAMQMTIDRWTDILH